MARADAPATTDKIAAPTILDIDGVPAAAALCLATRPPGQVYFGADAVAGGADKAKYAAARTTALAQLYRVRIPTEGFRLGEYDEDQSHLALDLTFSPRMMHGGITLAFPGESQAEFPVTAQAAKDIAAAVKSRKATLVTYFQLNDDQGAVCTGSVAAQVFTLASLPVVFELRDEKGASLARIETPRAQNLRQSWRPRLRLLELLLSMRPRRDHNNHRGADTYGDTPRQT